MKRIAFPLLAAGSLAGCIGAIYGDGEQIGSRDGKAVYKTSCTVDLSTAGRKGLFNTGTVPLHGSCDVSAANRCGKGNVTILDVQSSNRRMITENIQTGTMIQRRTFPAENQVMQFMCSA